MLLITSSQPSATNAPADVARRFAGRVAATIAIGDGTAMG